MIVHGGAWDLPDGERDAHRSGCLRALECGFALLAQGAGALAAVQAAVVALEDDPAFDAGTGSVLNEDGGVELDAALMDGRDLRVGAVAAVADVPNPVLLARAVLESEHAMLVAAGASRFAARAGVPTCDPGRLVVERERRRWASRDGAGDARAFFSGARGTVGAAALDRAGDLAAATSTGGAPGKPAGRVGDSPIVGAGVYAENRLAAVSATGYGEAILRLVWSFRAASLAGAGVPAPEACARAVRLLAGAGGHGGLVMVDADGRVGHARNTPAMAVAWRRDGEPARWAL